MQILDVNGKVLYETQAVNLKELVETAIAGQANLATADLRYAVIGDANLKSARLTHADLRATMLHVSNLQYASLDGANLEGACLTSCSMYQANLRGANLKGARLPSPTVVLLANWGELSDQLTADLMLWDSLNHPNPSAFDKWAETGVCPYIAYKEVSRAANFHEKPSLWGKGKECKPYDLMKRVLAEKCPPWTDEQLAKFSK